MKNQLKPNNYFYFLLTMVAIFAVPQLMAEHDDRNYRNDHRYSDNIIDIDIVNDRGRQFDQFPIYSNNYNIERAYLQAKDGKAYGIKVRNNSNERIGLVIAVDGRNIISGKKSKLRSKERMYILNPYQRATYDGWRSSKNRVNEFYFTDVPDSYADRTFGDRSAMGVIAVAVFKEKNGRWYRKDNYNDHSYKNDGSASRSKRERSMAAPQSKGGYESDSTDELGTGYGEDRYSPTRRVEFKAKKKAAVKHFIKYERKATLCEMGITSCGRSYRNRNRFWPNARNGGYAPAPPGIRDSRYDSYGIGIH